MKYRVYSNRSKKYITDSERCSWILKPDGTLKLNEYGDEVGSDGEWTIEFGSGVPDKTGVEVYEGDIIQLDDYVKETFGVSDGPVIYRGGSFLVGGNGGRGLLLHLGDIYYVLRGKIIGNIHDE